VHDTVTLAENVGPVPVRFHGPGSFGEMTQREPEFCAELEAADVARLCGLGYEDLDPSLRPQVVSTGTAFAILVVRSVAVLAKLAVRQQEASAWLRERGARWLYVLARTGEETPAWRARMQFHGGEDPATGSAAGCAISYLVKHGAAAAGERIHLRQGVEMGRPSNLYLSAKCELGKVSEVRVGGSTVPVATGQLFLP